jgi:protein SCO1
MTRAWLLALAFVTLLSRGARGEDALPAELRDVGIDERLGARVPLDAALVDQDGRPVKLGDYFDTKPVVIVMAYYECPMLCTVVLNGMREGMAAVAWAAGTDYRTLTISFDPRDTPDVAKKKRDNYVKAYGRSVGPRGWDFLTGKDKDVRRIADALGFSYRWDEEQKQFAHAAGAFVLTPDGRVSRTFYGVTFPARDLRLALADASDGRLGGVAERVLLYCFHYDPVARTYVVSPLQIMKLGGGLTIVLLGALLFMLWRKEAGRAAANGDGS